MMMQVVTRDEFYAFMGPLNVHPRVERDQTYWELPDRTLVGVTTPGWADGGRPDVEKTYAIPLNRWRS